MFYGGLFVVIKLVKVPECLEVFAEVLGILAIERFIQVVFSKPFV